MHKELPARPSVEHLKAQAKDLLAAYRRGDGEAFARFRDTLPAAHGAGDARLAEMHLALHDAQSAIAREYGFASWNELRQEVERRAAGELSTETLRALVQRHTQTPLPPEVEAAVIRAAATPAGVLVLPTTLPLVPIRNALLAPGSVAPLNIGRPSSLAAVDAARSGDGLLAMFAQRSEDTEAPTAEDLHPVGVAVRVLDVVPAGEWGTWIVVRAERWIRLGAVERTAPFATVSASEFVLLDGDPEELARLHRALGEKLRPLVEALPDAERLLRMTAAMSATELADAAIANLPCSVDDKARYAGEPRLAERLRLVLALLERSAA